MRKIVALVMLLLLLSGLLAGCSRSSSTAEKPAEINISYVKLPLNVPTIVEKKLNLFEKEFAKDGIQVVSPEITEGSKMTAALAAGSLDFCNALGGTSAILAAANGVDLKIIGIYSRAPKAFTIMTVDPEIEKIKDLKGKTIAGPKGTILHQLLLGALAGAGQSMADVDYVDMAIPEGVAAMFAGSVDAALVAGPEVIRAQKSGARVLTTGEGILDATIVIAVSGEFLNRYPDLVQRYLDVHHQSLEIMEERPEEVKQMAAEETGLSLEEVEEMLPLYDFTPAISEKDIVELEKTQDFLMENGMLENRIDIGDIIIEQIK
ncbi:MAG TPA: aliphatic sulfonate ABC transporter substrate-binding protein [Firmicutes bacterium]|nr:aliphatic sulfonate ABC transporter substrate-binding protein [Bacillota bacterium]